MQAQADTPETSWTHRHAVGLTLGGVTLFGLVLRLPGMNYCFAPDEAYSFDVYVRKGFRGIFLDQYQCNNQPFSSFMTWLSYLAFGESDWAIHLPALLFGLASIPLAYLVGKRLFGSRACGFAAACFLAVSPYHIAYSTNFRSYTAVMFLAMLSALLLHDNLVRPSLLKAAGLALATFLMALGHIVSLILLAGWAGVLGAYALGLVAVKAWRTRTRLIAWLSSVAALAVSGVLISVAYSPVFWLPGAVFGRAFHGKWPEAAEIFVCGAEQQVWHPFARFTETITGFKGGFFWAAAALAAIGTAVPLLRKRYSAGVCLAALACPILSLLILNLKIEPRYSLELHPFFALAFGAGLVHCSFPAAWACGRLAGRRALGTFIGAVLLAAPFLAGVWPLYCANFPHGAPLLACVFSDHKSAARYVAQHTTPEDVVTCFPSGMSPLMHYLNRYVYPEAACSGPPAARARLWLVVNSLQDFESARLPDAYQMRHVASFNGCLVYVGDLVSPPLREVDVDVHQVDDIAVPGDSLNAWRFDQYTGHMNMRTVADANGVRTEFTDLEGNLSGSMNSHPLPCAARKRFVYRLQIRKESSLRHVWTFVRFFDAKGEEVDGLERTVSSGGPGMPQEAYEEYCLADIVPPDAVTMSLGVFIAASRRPGATISVRNAALWVDWPADGKEPAGGAEKGVNP